MILFLLSAFRLGWLLQFLAVCSPFWLAATMWTPALGALLELKREGKLRPRPLGEEWPGLKTLYKATLPAAFWLALTILLAYFVVGPTASRSQKGKLPPCPSCRPAQGPGEAAIRLQRESPYFAIPNRRAPRQ
ncbi:hypothetical protein Pogu_1948 [Pyrobaculum oguniense TE7]|uniref:Uncharacterized protein n=1 Tax=Pyrobaculum oguniense (strain DSM 13380 / JCM 10595 / TE7) TaxID=698757 RepID=H6QCK7_PYROT|nr:hypothetical protein Pogu_1948 [Pyrobaculum oguniense TE7]